MRNLLLVMLMLPLVSLADFSEEKCKNAGGRIEAGSSSCDGSCNYYEKLFKNKTTQSICTRDMVERCICPEDHCYEEGKCVEFTKEMKDFFAAEKQKTALAPNVSCEKSGGKWRQFSNACADSCAKVRTPGMMCAMMMAMGCDCGPEKCFENGVCVAN